MRLYLSTFESGHQKRISEDFDFIYSSKYILMSYFYCRRLSKKYEKECLKLLNGKNQDNNLILDSGAFSFMNGKGSTEKEMDQYVNDYIDFINKWKIKRFIECDIDALFGYKKALYYRKLIEEKTGRQCIPVWHISRGLQAWKDMVRDYDFVAIGGFVIKEIKPKMYPQIKKLIKYANYRGVKVHGLGYTSKDMDTFGFYSTDSTSWSSGTRFGQIYQFKNNELVQHSKPAGTRAVADKVVRNNITAWIQYQKYLDRGR